ncbi:MAG: lipocalin family protein [Flavobacteriaceae bacterium]
MKNLNLCIGLLLGLIILSCSSEDDENKTDASILGKWILVSESYEGDEEPLSDCELMQTLTFNSDGTLEVYVLVDDDPCVFETTTVAYAKNENEFTVSIEEDGETFMVRNRIKKLTETELEFEDIWDNEIGDYPADERTTSKYNRTN